MPAPTDSSGELLLVFTHIAVQDPKREFVLGVRVPDSNIFEGEQAADLALACVLYSCSVTAVVAALLNILAEIQLALCTSMHLQTSMC